MAYQIPNTENVSPEQAEQTLKSIHAEAVEDTQHPYTNGNHFQHKDFITAVTRLHEIKAGDPEYDIDPVEQICNDAMNQQADDKYNKAVKTSGIVDKLEDEGFTGVPTVTTETPEWQGSLWSMQSHLHHQNHEVLQNDLALHIIKAKRDGLKLSGELEQKISAYNMTAGNTEDEKEKLNTLSDEILVELAEAHGEQDRRIKKALRPSGKPKYVPNCY